MAISTFLKVLWIGPFRVSCGRFLRRPNDGGGAFFGPIPVLARLLLYKGVQVQITKNAFDDIGIDGFHLFCKTIAHFPFSDNFTGYLFYHL